MRSSAKNKRTFHFKLYMGMVDKVDTNGDYTGRKVPQYGDITEYRANISQVSGYVAREKYGINSDYVITITTSNMNCPIVEDSVLWVSAETDKPYDYIVDKVSKSLNEMTIVAHKVLQNGN